MTIVRNFWISEVKNMKKIHIGGMIAGLLLLAIIAGTYAHSQQSEEKVDYMDTMHEEMMEDLEDPELRIAVESMHEGCEQFHRGKKNIAVRGHMMGMMG